MKRPLHYFSVGAVVLFFGFNCLGQTDPNVRQTVPVTGRANPALARVQRLYVIIEPTDLQPEKDGLVFKNIQDKVENQLEQAGLQIAPGIVLGKGQRDRDIPELRLYMELLRFPDSQIYVFRVQTAFAQKAKLADRNLFFKAEVWHTAPAMQAVTAAAMPEEVTNVILMQTKAFIAAWLDANRSKKAADVQQKAVTQDSSQLKTQKQSKSTPLDFKYAASKNSRVFHKPDCSFVETIKPKNLVFYKSRAEAIKDGKRPCRRCKP